MSLVFGANSTDRVDCGNPGTSPTITTQYAWVYITTLSLIRFITAKRDTGSGGVLQFYIDNTTGALAGNISYSGGLAQVTSNTGLLLVNTWQFVAMTTNNTADALRLYIGGLATPPTEVAYSVQNTPSGSRTADNGANLIIANRAQNDRPMQGRMATFNYIDGTALTAAELRTHWMRPHKHANSKVFYQLGYNGTGTQADWSGSGLNGTVTGATVGPHVPLGPVFGANVYAFPAAAATAKPWHYYQQMHRRAA